MIDLSPHFVRRVIPNWRSFEDTASNGELASFSNESRKGKPLSINSYISSWINNKTLAVAADLISAAIVNGFIINEEVIEATNFILKPDNSATLTQKRLAENILKQAISNRLHLRLIKINSDDFLEHVNKDFIIDKIQELKRLKEKFPKNPIYYVEISRWYLILGHTEQAMMNMHFAIQLAPTNRFVLRSAVRLFTHAEESDYAHDLLRRTEITQYDPWLTSAEISVATLRGKSSRFVKKGIEIIRSKNFSPFSISELSSSIATLEFFAGNRKKSREFFNISLIDPNDNSTAQAEWALSKDKHLQINPIVNNIKLNFEALAIDNLNSGDYKSSLDNAARWFFDLPFSKRPVLFGSFVARVWLENEEKARDFLRAGLLTRPFDAHLLNNLAYSFALEDRIEEAQAEINKVSSSESVDEATEICLLATQGLIHFRKGIFDLGRTLYLEAIERTKETGNRELNWSAILNYAREEILARQVQHADSIMNVVATLQINGDDAELIKLKNKVEQLYNKFKNRSLTIKKF